MADPNDSIQVKTYGEYYITCADVASSQNDLMAVDVRLYTEIWSVSFFY